MSPEAKLAALLAERGGRLDHKPGVYFGLHEDDYHADTGLGSGDIRAVANSPADFWFEGKLNPDWKPTTTDAQAAGTAVHKIVLEGRAAFERSYGMTDDTPWNIKAGKTQKEAVEAEGKFPVKYTDWKRYLSIAHIINSDPNLTGAFTEDVIGTEVSIFWIDKESGLKLKCRIDGFKPFASVDLKHISNQNKKAFRLCCLDFIASWESVVQATLYTQGRKAAGEAELPIVFVKPEFRVDETKVRRALKRDAAWVWVFVQSAAAPLVKGFKMSPGNPMFDDGSAIIARGIANYLDYMKRLGPNTPWLVSEPLEELQPDDMPYRYHLKNPRP